MHDRRLSLSEFCELNGARLIEFELIEINWWKFSQIQNHIGYTMRRLDRMAIESDSRRQTNAKSHKSARFGEFRIFASYGARDLLWEATQLTTTHALHK